MRDLFFAEYFWCPVTRSTVMVLICCLARDFWDDEGIVREVETELYQVPVFGLRGRAAGLFFFTSKHASKKTGL